MDRSRLVAVWLFAALYAGFGPPILVSILAEGRVDIGLEEAWIVSRADNPVLFFGHLVVMGIAWVGLTGFAVWGAVHVLGGWLAGARYRSRRIVPAPGPDGTPVLQSVAVAVFMVVLTGLGAVMLYGAVTEGKVVQMCRRSCHNDTFDRLLEPDNFGVAVSDWVLLTAVLLPFCLGAVLLAWRSVREWLRGESW